MAQSTHPELPFVAHRGDGPYLFVCYAHADAHAVYDELRWLRQEGANVWYDEGIQPGHVWPRELAHAIENCSLVLLFVSAHSLASPNCLREVHFAVERDKPLVAIFLDDSKLPSDWEFAIGHRQAILKPRLSEAMYREKLRGVLAEHARVGAPRFARPSPQTPSDPKVSARPFAAKRWRNVSLAILGIVAVTAGSALWWQHRVDRAWLTDVATPALQAHIAQDHNGKAYFVAQEIERRLGARAVDDGTWLEVSAQVALDSTPSGAAVSFRLYDDPQASFIPLGQTPLANVRLPRDWVVLRFEKDGFETTLRATASPGVFAPDAGYARSLTDRFAVAAENTHRVALTPRGAVPPGMVAVPASSFPLHYIGFSLSTPIETPDFFIDRLETTNAEFREFVEAGGYEDERWWTDLEFVDGATKLDWRSAVARFTDSTGKAGPSGWELGDFLPGTADQPVTGISWYEAMAYARFREKSLPSLQLWVRAAMTLVECCEPISPKMAQRGNFGARLVDAGTSGAFGPYGTLDAGGNAAEWVLNAQGERRLAMGGSVNEAPYAFIYYDPASPWDRSGYRGIRTVKLAAPLDERLRAEVPAPVLPPVATPMSEEAFAALVATYEFVPTAADPRIEAETSEAFGTLRRISLRTGVADERFTAYVLLPANAKPPFESVIAMSGVEGFTSRSPIESRLDWTIENFFRPVLRSGRAVVWPVWYGSFERFDNLPANASRDGAGWRERDRNWRRDADAVISYLESSPDFNDRIAFYGVSFGAAMTPRLLYLVPEFKAAVLVSGGNALTTPEAAAFVGHVTTPTLFLNGRFDYVIPNAIVRRYFDNIATPPEHKRRVEFDSSHWPLPRNQLTREIDAWLDTYLSGAKGG